MVKILYSLYALIIQMLLSIEQELYHLLEHHS